MKIQIRQKTLRKISIKYYKRKMQLNIHKKNAKPMAAEKSSTVSAFSALSSMIDRFRIVFVLCV